MQENKLEKLKSILELMQNDTITPNKLGQFITAIVKVVKDSKDSMESTSQEVKNTLNDALIYLEKEHGKLVDKVSSDTEDRLSKTEKKVLDTLNKAQEALDAIKSITVRDGVDADEDIIVEKVLAKIELPEYKEVELDEAEDIVEKLESLEGEDRLDAKAIKNLPKMVQTFVGGSTGNIKEIIAGTGVTIDNTNAGYPVITSTASGSGIVETVVAGDGISVDSTDPANPIVTNTNPTPYTLPTASDTVLGGVKIGARLSIDGNGVLSADLQSGGTGVVETIVAGNNIDVDSTDPANPIVSVETLTLADISDVTASITELNYIDGVTSSIQTQLGDKVPTSRTVAGKALTSDVTIALDDLSDVVISTPLVDQVLKYNGTNFVNGNETTVNGGAGVELYYVEAASDISGYSQLLRTPDTGGELDETVVVNNNEVLINEYATPSTGLGGTKIDSGIWTFDIWAYVDVSLSGSSSVKVDMYKRTSGGTETLLFTVNSGSLMTSLGSEPNVVTTVQPEFTINATDRLVAKVYGKNTAGVNRTVHFFHGGTAHYSHINSPLVTRHNDLAGLQGGTSNEYNHITNAQLSALHGVNDANTTSNTYADGKVAQTITNGVTTSAPSQDAVFDALALKAPLASPTFTGTVTLPTGSTTVAPIKMVAGTNLTTPVAGVFEFDGTSLFFSI